MTTSDANAQVAGPIEVGIVPHTHWDREWYEPLTRNGYQTNMCTDQRKQCP
jgi:hypothetical protein